MAGVDVLAVMDVEISVWAGRMSARGWEARWPEAREQHATLIAARAAVAELIEAMRETDKDLTVLLSNVTDAAARDPKWDGMPAVIGRWIDRNRAVLRNVQGGA